MPWISLLYCCLVAAPEATPAEPPQKTTAAYVEKEADPLQSLDIYAPRSGADMPVMIFIHGGAWRFGDKRQVQQKPTAFAAHGMIFISVNYRMHPQAPVEEQAADVARAIHWTREHVKEFGGSPDKVFLMGHSAGAHLAALVVTDESYLEKQGETLAAICGVILLDGAGYDVARQLELAVLPRIKELYSTVFGTDAKRHERLSPFHHIAKGKAIPPFQVFYVATRRDSKIQSEDLVKKMGEAGIKAKAISAERKTHATINREFGDDDDLVTEQAFEFLKQRLAEEVPAAKETTEASAKDAAKEYPPTATD